MYYSQKPMRFFMRVDKFRLLVKMLSQTRGDNRLNVQRIPPKHIFSPMVLAFSMLMCVQAADLQPYYIGDGFVSGAITRSSNSYTVSASSGSGTERVVVSGTLYEKGWLWDKSVASCSNAFNGSGCTASGSYTFDNSKSYRLEYSATFYYSDGTSETVSGSTTG